ncbi:MAG: tetratricopeptide repeat protein, partial [Vibrionaceae bacterium]
MPAVLTHEQSASLSAKLDIIGASGAGADPSSVPQARRQRAIAAFAKVLGIEQARIERHVHMGRVAISTVISAILNAEVRPLPRAAKMADLIKAFLTAVSEDAAQQAQPANISRGAGPDTDPGAGGGAAFSAITQAAHSGSASAQHRLGTLYANGQGGVEQDDKLAVQWYRAAAEQGHVDAQNCLGVMCASGRGTTQDEEEAVRWYRAAAALGHSEAQYNLGNMCVNGRGTRQDNEEAVSWYRKAAFLGDSDAQYNLANMYANGCGVPNNDKLAMYWYHEAAGQGDADACFNLGVMYANGRGVDIGLAHQGAAAFDSQREQRNDEKAVHWFRKAVRRGSVSAQYNLGHMHAMGRGVQQCYRQAYAWFAAAAANGHAEASEAQNDAATRLTPTQLDEAKQLAA